MAGATEERTPIRTTSKTRITYYSTGKIDEGNVLGGVNLAERDVLVVEQERVK
jgi:hypothetical protein